MTHANRIGYLSVLDFNLYRSRLRLMQALRDAGTEVVVITPEGSYGHLFAESGIRYVPYPLNRSTFNPLVAWRQVREITKLFRELELDSVHAFTLRPNVYGALAAARANIPNVIVTVSGLGSLYSENSGLKTRVLRGAVDWITKKALRNASRVIFQNEDDMAYYVDRRICTSEQATLICSSGVDTLVFSRERVPPERRDGLRQEWAIRRDLPVVAMITRFVAQKGIRDFIALAETLRGKAQFVLIGEPDPGNPHAISWRQIQPHIDRGVVLAPGRQTNIPEWLSITDVYVYPSYYREGVPRTVLEAMAMELPIVTTDSPGCREPMKDGINGYLISPRNADQLKDRVVQLIEDRDLRERMGARSRAIIQDRFSAEAILEQYLVLYRQLGIL